MQGRDVGVTFAFAEREVQVVNVEMDDVELFFQPEHMFHQNKMVRQIINGNRREPQRLGASGYQPRCSHGIATSE